ncbi:MAG: hypothetical protein C5B48_13490 [Candidatus Rokuibacteriota bacterium]|nr:MAG: hypothetical protein C5B48_13490 [Candidatus Rokubacteria bacterium]
MPPRPTPTSGRRVASACPISAYRGRRRLDVDEAKLIETEGGLKPEGEGWFVVNVRDAAWLYSDDFGSGVVFQGEGPASFPELGINISVLQPGEPNCRYHAESNQEDFLVLSGECLLLVEGQERPLRAWDFVHCPSWTEHVFVGAGDGPCVLLAVGSRRPDEELRYPVSEVALSHGAGVHEETSDPRHAYADVERARPGPAPAEGMPWR